MSNNYHLKKVDELHELTDSALFYAERNDIQQVRKIDEKRKSILQELKSCINNAQNKTVFKKMIMRLLEKDYRLDEKLRVYKERLDVQKVRYGKRKRLRRRFVDRKCGVPRFIDRKA